MVGATWPSEGMFHLKSALKQGENRSENYGVSCQGVVRKPVDAGEQQQQQQSLGSLLGGIAPRGWVEGLGALQLLCSLVSLKPDYAIDAGLAIIDSVSLR